MFRPSVFEQLAAAIWLLPFHHQHGEGSRLDLRPALLSSWQWLHVSRSQVQALGLRIDGHGLSAYLRMNVAYRHVLIRALLLDHRYCAVIIGGEDHLVIRIVGYSVDALTDRK